MTAHKVKTALTTYSNRSLSTSFGLGGAAFSGTGGGYGFGACSEDEVRNIIDKAFDLKINLIDTAPIYGLGNSERLIGKNIKDKRDDQFIVTKSGVDWHENRRVNMCNSPKVTKKMLEESLSRLDSDYIDMYMIHWPDKNVDIRRPLEVLAMAKEQGKIRYIGLCNTNCEDLSLAREISSVDGIQCEYNFFNQKNFAQLEEQLRGDELLMGWGSLDKGILSASVKKDTTFDKCDARSWAPWWKKSNKDIKIKFVGELEKQLKSKNISLIQFALSLGCFRNENVLPLVGVKSIAQLDSTWRTFEELEDLPLDPEVLDEANELWGKFNVH